MNSSAYVIPKERLSSGQEIHRIVVVGGGAGGLELVTQLGDSLGRSKKPKSFWSINPQPIFGSHYCMKWQRAVWIRARINWNMSLKLAGIISSFIRVR